jgi:transposase-like protein
VLNYLPKALQPKAKGMLQQIWMASTRQSAHSAFDRFIASFGAKYPKAVECLQKDRAGDSKESFPLGILRAIDSPAV